MSSLAIVVCTRNRAPQLHETLDHIDRLEGEPIDVVVVDQSDVRDARLHERAAAGEHLTVIEDPGRGLSRSRNIGWKAVRHDWVAYVDDDCHPAADWGNAMRSFLEHHPDADWVSPHVGGSDDRTEAMRVSTFPVEHETRLSGRRTMPYAIGLGVCMVVRRSTVERLNGWDERLGPPSTDFPASDDMDFNYRLLRDGGVAYLTPEARVEHVQWRSEAELAQLFRRYMAGWCGFAMKTVRQGDIRGGLWLWSDGVRDFTRMLASAGRRRSMLRLHVAWAKWRGLVRGTSKGLLRRW